MFTEAVCMSSVLPSCCWLVRQAGPLSMENFLWPGQPGSRHHSTDTLNSTNYYCYVLSKPASKTLIQINSDSCTNVFSRGVNKPTTQQTSHANDFVNVKSHARNKPPISSQSIFFLKGDVVLVPYICISRKEGIYAFFKADFFVRLSSTRFYGFACHLDFKE